MERTALLKARGWGIAVSRRDFATLPLVRSRLGGPSFDFLVELVDAGPTTPFFFVQVKTTRKDYTRTQRPPRLRVEISEEDTRQMVAFPAPTYVIGVHEREERAFVISVHEGMSEAIPSITTAHELNGATLLRLWQEVRGFWQGRDMRRTMSSFHNQ
jgi:hypothetical protein